MSKPREWLYGAEFWVPENHMFKCGSECLEAFPNAGPACGIVSTSAYQKLEQELAESKEMHRSASTYHMESMKELAEAKAEIAIHIKNSKAAQQEIERLQLEHLHDPWLGPVIGKTWEFVVKEKDDEIEARDAIIEKMREALGLCAEPNGLLEKQRRAREALALYEKFKAERK